MPSETVKPRKLLLKNGLSPGDIVMLTAAVRDLHAEHPGQFLTGVKTTAQELWDHNPFVTPLDGKDPDVETIQCEYPLIHHCNQRPFHFIHGFAQHLGESLGISIAPRRFYGDIHLSPEERGWMSQVEEVTGSSDPFWIIVAGGKRDYTIKWWDHARFQSVVNRFRGRIRFVQVGEGGHHHPRLEGTIDLRGKTGIRQLVRLVYHSQGVVCPVTFLMHLAAAVPSKCGPAGTRPCVVIAGGREPAHWECYPGHRFLHTQGALPCCATGGCWKSRAVPLGDGDAKDKPENLCERITAEKLPRCMDLITVDDVVHAIESYFAGGMIDYLNKSSQAIRPSRTQPAPAEASRKLGTFVRFAGMKRHGNHGVINWLLAQFHGKIVFRNNAGKYTRLINTRCDPINALEDGNRCPVDLEEPGDKRLFVVSWEDKDPSEVFDSERTRTDEDWIGHRIGRSLQVVLLRDPFNYFASRLQGERNGDFKRDLRFSDPGGAEALIRLWKEYARWFEWFDQDPGSERIAINYNRWLLSREYRVGLSQKIGGDACDDSGRRVVSGWGGGSSFVGMKLDQPGAYLSRWRRFASHPGFQELAQDRELMEIAERLFGDTIDLDEIRGSIPLRQKAAPSAICRREFPLVTFRGGLGDVILKIYRSDAYTALAGADGPIHVVIGSTNPFSGELFRWHPNRLNFVVTDLSSHFVEHRSQRIGPDESMRRAIAFAGLPDEKRLYPRGEPVVFHAIDSIESRGHIVFQPFAGQRARNMPPEAQERFCDLFAKLDIPVFVATRSYLRQNLGKGDVCHREEDFLPSVSSNVTVLTHTSVPATLKLIQDCSVFIGGDSALVHCAWSEAKPTIYLKGRRMDESIGKGYLWGAFRPDCLYYAFDQVNWEEACRFIQKQCEMFVRTRQKGMV